MQKNHYLEKILFKLKKNHFIYYQLSHNLTEMELLIPFEGVYFQNILLTIKMSIVDNSFSITHTILKSIPQNAIDSIDILLSGINRKDELIEIQLTDCLELIAKKDYYLSLDAERDVDTIIRNVNLFANQLDYVAYQVLCSIVDS